MDLTTISRNNCDENWWWIFTKWLYTSEQHQDNFTTLDIWNASWFNALHTVAVAVAGCNVWLDCSLGLHLQAARLNASDACFPVEWREPTVPAFPSQPTSSRSVQSAHQCIWQCAGLWSPVPGYQQHLKTLASFANLGRAKYAWYSYIRDWDGQRL